MSIPPPGIYKKPLDNASQMLKGTNPPVKQKSTSPLRQVTLDLSISSLSPNPLPVRTEDDIDVVYDDYLAPADSASNIEHMDHLTPTDFAGNVERMDSLGEYSITVRA